MGASAYDRIVEKFGRKPEVRVFGPTAYRVTVSGWMVHSGASTCRPCGDGRTLEKACEALLKYCDNPAAWVHEGDMCQDHTCCVEYSTMRDKQELNRKAWREAMDDAAARVARMPYWKRGLQPCAEDRCEGEYEHEGLHWRTKPVDFEEWG